MQLAPKPCRRGDECRASKRSAAVTWLGERLLLREIRAQRACPPNRVCRAPIDAGQTTFRARLRLRPANVVGDPRPGGGALVLWKLDNGGVLAAQVDPATTLAEDRLRTLQGLFQSPAAGDVPLRARPARPLPRGGGDGHVA